MDYDKWLEQPYIRRANRSAEIEKMIEDVLQEDDFNPLNAETFCTVISEGVINDIPEEILTKALNDEDGFCKLGRIIYESVYRWCYDIAENEAAERYNNQLG